LSRLPRGFDLSPSHAVPLTKGLLDEPLIRQQITAEPISHRSARCQTTLQGTTDHDVNRQAAEERGQSVRLFDSYRSQGILAASDESESPVGRDLAMTHQKQPHDL
jgi:hypothetical protein